MAEPERQTAVVDPTKLDYLGRGVDCREPRETWLEMLDAYGADKIRDLAPNSGNVKQTPVQKNKTESSNETIESKKGVEGNAKVSPHKAINLGGELKVHRDISRTTKCRIDSWSTKIVTMCEDISKDPNIINRGGDPPIHYTKYEIELSRFILEHIETMQTDTASEGKEPKCLEKKIKDLERGDPVAMLEDYLQYARSNKEICQQIRQILANACCFFINKEKPYTHYVRSITLGAIQQESYESQDSNCDISGGAQVSTPDVVDGSLKGGYQAANNSLITRNESRGHIDFDSGNVTVEEVIEASMEPVSSLINKKSRELKVIMEWLLQCYSHTNQGVPQGPFHTSCKKRLSFPRREHEIFWQVIDDEIYGTTSASEASTFYIQRINEKFCHIIHKTSTLQMETFITVQRPFKNHLPLKLVESADQQDISFILMNKTKQPVDVPQTEDAWKRGSPFFIELPAGGIFFGRFSRPERYISVRYFIEKDKKTVSSDGDSKEKEPKLTPASTCSATSDIKKGDKVKETRESHNRESVVEKPKYTTGSSATPVTTDNYVITTQFYFTPVGNVLGSSVTLSGPPPPPSRIESDSASDRNEFERQQEEDDIKQAFIKLVGGEYVFPLQIKAAAILDMKSQ